MSRGARRGGGSRLCCAMLGREGRVDFGVGGWIGWMKRGGEGRKGGGEGRKGGGRSNTLGGRDENDRLCSELDFHPCIER